MTQKATTNTGKRACEQYRGPLLISEEERNGRVRLQPRLCCAGGVIGCPVVLQYPLLVSKHRLGVVDGRHNQVAEALGIQRPFKETQWQCSLVRDGGEHMQNRRKLRRQDRRNGLVSSAPVPAPRMHSTVQRNAELVRENNGDARTVPALRKRHSLDALRRRGGRLVGAKARGDQLGARVRRPTYEKC